MITFRNLKKHSTLLLLINSDVSLSPAMRNDLLAVLDDYIGTEATRYRAVYRTGQFLRLLEVLISSKVYGIVKNMFKSHFILEAGI